MPQFGGYCPFPLRLGGSKPRVETITKALNAARGTAHDVATDSPAWVEDNAVARGIASVWNVNELLGNQFDPRRMSIMLSRWEKILAIPRLPTDTDAERRAKVLAVMARTGVAPWYQEVYDRLVAAFAPVTISIAHSAPGGTGVISSWKGGWHVQATGTSPPTVTLTGQPAANYERFQIDMIAGGVVGVSTFQYTLDGSTFSTTTTTASSVSLGTSGLTATFAAGTYDADNRYYASPVTVGFWSTVAYLAIVATKPTWMTESAYYEKIKECFPILDSFLPAWITFAVVRDGTVVGDFKLDEVNLDNQRFSGL